MALFHYVKEVDICLGYPVGPKMIVKKWNYIKQKVKGWKAFITLLKLILNPIFWTTKQ